MPDIDARLGREVLVIDGAMGTMLHRAGVMPGQSNEYLNITAPELVLDVHRNYVLAGADCITTNTFGATRAKLAEYSLADQVEAINRAGVELARSAGAIHILADVGPTGLVMEPLGSAGFDEVKEHFAEQIRALAAEEPDAILIETMTDIAEARCAVIAARDVCDLPVIVSLTFGQNGRAELSGTSPEAAAVILEALGVAAIGANCGLGPAQMLPIIREFAAFSALPILAQPNAGMPRIEDGETVFPGTADEMGEHAAMFVDAGASLVGSCCGSSPSFTGAVSDFAKGRPTREAPAKPSGLALASSREAIRIGGSNKFAVIGERINPTGKPRLAETLANGSMSVVRELALDQHHDGADALDVNVGAAQVEEVEALAQAVKALSALTELPLVLDNTDAEALEAALKAYPGRAMVNSVNGTDTAIETILPLAAKYGASVLILALDETIPETVEGRLAVAQRVRSAAHAAGLGDRDLAVDPIVMTVATDPDSASVSLETIRRIDTEWGLPTVVGLSNVSHGLPQRPALNATFLAMAESAGLSAAIMDPSDLQAMRAHAASELLSGRDPGAERWIAWARSEADAEASADIEAAGPPASPAESLTAAIIAGDADSAPGLVDELVSAGMAPGDIIGEAMTPAIQDLGAAFGRGEVFLPQLIVAADAMKSAVAAAKKHLPDTESLSAGKVVFGTVKGDIHSIGKDICVSLLESAGFDVEDLGVDVGSDRILDAAARADVVCMSALMTTTLPAMRAAAVAVTAAGVPVVVGGAVVTESFAQSIGADYADDAPGCVSRVREVLARRG